MPLDLAMLTSTPDLRMVPPVQARIVAGLRYIHTARLYERYCARQLAKHIGSQAAVHCLHVFLAEAVQAWPEPIALGAPCHTRMSYDEMLLVDCTTAAARRDPAAFHALLRDMTGEADRRALWFASVRLMRAMGAPHDVDEASGA